MSVSTWRALRTIGIAAATETAWAPPMRISLTDWPPWRTSSAPSSRPYCCAQYSSVSRRARIMLRISAASETRLAQREPPLPMRLPETCLWKGLPRLASSKNCGPS